MMTNEIWVTFIGFIVVIFGIWFLSSGKHSTTKAVLSNKGYQEALVVVQRGYSPDIVIVQQGTPVRLNFLRAEASICSHTVILSEFGKSIRLVEDEVEVIEFTPHEVGEFPFQCHMGMLQGKLIVQ